ncbi:MAG: hypothetical protein LCI00_31575 [Chloroflexi bacterium]|nr:hypothetical protein [Chloroflexota bacterium]MCC6893606.1 hypothetical protein [Anaerolineae bacterium]
MKTKLERRDFLKMIGIGASSASITGIAPKPIILSRQSAPNYRFTVNVPNLDETPTSVQLRLEEAEKSDLELIQLDLETYGLEVVNTGISLDPFANESDSRLEINLEPRTSVDVYVFINIISTGQTKWTAFNLIDEREGIIVGGVLLVVTDPPITEVNGQIVPARDPCLATLAQDIYWVNPGDDPSKPDNNSGIPPEKTVELIAAITNPTTKPLSGVTVYLEHLGKSNAEYEPGTWNIGTLEADQVFYASWLIHTTAWQSGTFEASIIATSDDTNPIRLNSNFVLGEGSSNK